MAWVVTCGYGSVERDVRDSSPWSLHQFGWCGCSEAPSLEAVEDEESTRNESEWHTIQTHTRMHTHTQCLTLVL